MTFNHRMNDRHLDINVLYLVNFQNTGENVATITRNNKRIAEARVDIRKFAQLLIGEQINPHKVICSKFIWK